MNRITIILIIPLLLNISLSVKAGKKITIEDIYAIKQVGNPLISPDNSGVIFSSQGYIWLIDLMNDSISQFTNGRPIRWSPDGKSIVFTRAGEIWIKSVKDGRETRLLDFIPRGFVFSNDLKKIAYLEQDKKEDERAKTGERVPMLLNANKKLRTHIWIYDLTTQRSGQITWGDNDDFFPVWSPDDSRVAFLSKRTPNEEDHRNYDIYTISAEGHDLKQLTFNTGPDINPVWSPNGEWISYVSNRLTIRGHADSDLQIIASNGGIPKNLTENFDYSVGRMKGEIEGGMNIYFSADGGNIYFSTSIKTADHLFSVPSRGGQVRQISKVDAIYDDSFHLSGDGNKVVFTMMTPESPKDIFVSDLDNWDPERLTDLNPDIRDFELAKTEVIKWKGADDWDIEGVLVYPLEYDANKRYPLIVHPHGGPYDRAGLHFNGRYSHSNCQIFASEGYAVLMPNFRGSSGYGEEFAMGDQGDWGGRDFIDIMKGVDKVVEMRLADPDKLAIMGASYGGFMSFWAVTQTDRFKLAVAGCGISDWISQYGTMDDPNMVEFGFRGKPWDNLEAYDRFSPIRYVNNVKTPVLIWHGENDVRVPVTQSYEFFRFMKKSGKEVELVVYPGEGHGVSNRSFQTDILNRQMEWLNKYLQ